MKANDFKESLESTMIELYKKDGYLEPIMFFLNAGEPEIVPIPEMVLESKEAKARLSYIIKQICKDPDVEAAGIIMEAYAVAVHKDSEMVKLIEDGNLAVADVKSKKDAIVFLFATPKEEKLIHYEALPEEREMINRTESDAESKSDGIFSNLFQYRIS